jgi:cytochrome c oxidase subunit 2
MTFRNARIRLRTVRFRLILPLSVLALTVLTACASDAKQDALKPAGPVARMEHNLFVPVFWIAAAIFFLVEGLAVYAVVRFRDRPGRTDPKQIHGNTRLELGWTILPALILLVVSIPTVITIFKVSAKEGPNDVKVRVIGHQWWWEYEYLNTNPPIRTANELVIPVGRQVFLELDSADVIHSFWIPQLGGKQDVEPARTNTLAFSADRPGEYHGQCAEFCSVSHANMRLLVVAKTEAEFAQWVTEQQKPAVEAASAEAIAGKQVFMTNACIACHAIAGTPASGRVGPDLTHFASRKTFGSVVYDTTPENLFEWIKHARVQKPGVLMPNFDEPLDPKDPAAAAVGQTPVRVLSDAEIRQMVAYLLSLK